MAETVKVVLDIDDRGVGVNANGDGPADAVDAVRQAHHRRERGKTRGESTTGRPPKLRSAGPRSTLETTVCPETVGQRSPGSNRPTPQRNTAAGTASRAAAEAVHAGCSPAAVRGELPRDPFGTILWGQLGVQVDSDIAKVVVRPRLPRIAIGTSAPAG